MINKNETPSYDEKIFNDSYFKSIGNTGANKEYEWLLDNFDFSTFIEIGPGNGNFINGVKKAGKEVYFSDYSSFIMNKLKDIGVGFNVPVWNMREIDRGFDIVFCSDVLHLIPESEREKAVSELNRITDEYLIANIPCESWNSVPHHERFIGRTPTSYINIETREFWLNLFKKYGFIDKSEEYTSPFHKERIFILKKRRDE